MENIGAFNTKNSSLRCLHMLRTGYLSDCEFIVNEDEGGEEKGEKSNSVTKPKVFRCHKMILALNSEVFERMLYGEFAEKSNPVLISDISPEVFEILLGYIYSHKISHNEVNFKNIAQLIYAGEKYLIKDFVVLCVDIIEETDNWPINSILPMYQSSLSSGSCKFITLCQKIICSRFSELFFYGYEYNPDRSNNVTTQYLKILNVNCLENLIIFLTQHTKIKHNDLLKLLELYGRERTFLEKRQLEELSKLHDAASHLNKLSFIEKSKSFIFKQKW